MATSGRRAPTRRAAPPAVIGLGDDLPPGAHTVTVAQRGGPRTWVRFFALTQTARPEQAFQIRRLETPDE